MKYIKGLFSLLSKVVVILACIYGIVFLPKLFNYHPHIITDDAMYPTYLQSSIVYYTETNYQNILKGDIVSFKENDLIKCARVYEINNNVFVIRNDNKDNFNKRTITSDRLVGKNINIMIRFLGAYILFVQNNLKMILPIAGGILFISFIFIFIEPKDKSKKKILNIDE